MVIKRKADLLGTNRHIKNNVYETVRFLLAPDRAGITVTDIVLNPGIEETYGYDKHIEIAYCISGRATLQVSENQEAHYIEPGVLWFARPGETFKFVAQESTRLICVFSPDFRGEETGFANDTGEST
ncbi:MAG: ectoine synthase [Trueperaceae bacterium]